MTELHEVPCLTTQDYFTNPFDLDIKISELNTIERMTYNAVRNIILDKQSGWTHAYYKYITITTHDAYASQYKNKLAICQKNLDSFNKRMDALQEKGTLTSDEQTELSELKVSIVECLNDIDSYTDAIHINSYKGYTERMYNNTLHDITHEFRRSDNRDMLVEKVKTFITYYLSIILK
jgi:hypothetical protein